MADGWLHSLVPNARSSACLFATVLHPPPFSTPKQTIMKNEGLIALNMSANRWVCSWGGCKGCRVRGRGAAAALRGKRKPAQASAAASDRAGHSASACKLLAQHSPTPTPTTRSDEEVFSDPDTFNIHRSDAELEQQVAYGSGTHRCEPGGRG